MCRTAKENIPGVFAPAYSLILEDLLMPDAVKVGFVPFSAAPRGILVVFCDEALKFGDAARKALGSAAGLVGRAAATVALNGRALKGWSAAGLMARAVTFDRDAESPAPCTSRTNSSEARGEKNIAASSARASIAARAESGRSVSSRASYRATQKLNWSLRASVGSPWCTSW